MRAGFAALISALLLAGLLSLGSAHHKPDHQIPPGQQTSTTESTTTTQATTTTTQATTTTTVSSLSLTEALVLTEDTTLTGTIEGNGYSILIDGADVTMVDLTINNVNRVMWHGACGVAQLDNVTVSNSGVTGEEGAYPLHWHLCGDSTRGTVVQNTTVVNGQNHAFVPHGSNGISFLNSTAQGVINHAFWWDPPGTNRITCDAGAHRKYCVDDNSNDILIDGMHIDGVSYPRDIEPCCGIHHTISAYILGAGSGNVIRNSTVANVSGGLNCAGFNWPAVANQNFGGNVWVFENNRALDMTACHGIRVWQNDPNDHQVPSFTGGGISHGAYTNDYTYANVDVPYFDVHAVGWQIFDSHVGHAKFHRHTLAGDPVEFTNVTFDSLIVDDGDNAIEPATYIISGTNIACSDVVWQEVHPDSELWIDGQLCEVQ